MIKKKLSCLIRGVMPIDRETLQVPLCRAGRLIASGSLTPCFGMKILARFRPGRR